MTIRRLRPVNLTAREQMELGLLLSLLGDRAGSEWRVEEGIGADAAIVDIDDEAAEEVVARARRTEHAVILLSASRTNDDELRLTRPLRSEALIRVLSAIDGGAGERGAPAADAREATYRLRRWPGTSLLRREWRYTRVCGALGRGPRTAQALAQRTGIEGAALAEILEELVEAGCVERADDAGGALPAPIAPTGDGLFARIRARLARV